MALGKYKILITPENPNGIKVNYTTEELEQIKKDVVRADTEQKKFFASEDIKKQDAINGNKKLLDLGLTQAEATSLTGYKPPVEE